ncbi:unnamed protein product [Gordionus sp. m RMFG-2023]
MLSGTDRKMTENYIKDNIKLQEAQEVNEIPSTSQITTVVKQTESFYYKWGDGNSGNISIPDDEYYNYINKKIDETFKVDNLLEWWAAHQSEFFAI